MSERRIQALEELAAHQSRMIEEMSDEIANLSGQLRELRSGLEALGRTLAQMQEDTADSPGNQRPPHW